MKLNFFYLNNRQLAELIDEDLVFNDVDDIIDLLGNASYQGAYGIIIREQNLNSGFFDLSTRIAGEMLQKFSNYRMKLAIIGDYSKYPSKNLSDFIFESNKAGHILFVRSKEEAIYLLTR